MKGMGFLTSLCVLSFCCVDVLPPVGAEGTVREVERSDLSAGIPPGDRCSCCSSLFVADCINCHPVGTDFQPAGTEVSETCGR